MWKEKSIFLPQAFLSESHVFTQSTARNEQTSLRKLKNKLKHFILIYRLSSCIRSGHTEGKKGGNPSVKPHLKHLKLKSLHLTVAPLFSLSTFTVDSIRVKVNSFTSINPKSDCHAVCVTEEMQIFLRIIILNFFFPASFWKNVHRQRET